MQQSFAVWCTTSSLVLSPFYPSNYFALFRPKEIIGKQEQANLFHHNGPIFLFLSLLILAFNLQVPTKYFFDCTGRCKHNLSKKGGWMKERSFCIEFLTRIYGYLPLLYTTSRADPVAAEIPSVKEYGKCFKPTWQCLIAGHPSTLVTMSRYNS